MNARVEAFVEQARSLTAEERVAALDALQELVTPPDSAWQQAWVAESEDRLDTYLRGEVEAEEFDNVMERLRIASARPPGRPGTRQARWNAVSLGLRRLG